MMEYEKSSSIDMLFSHLAAVYGAAWERSMGANQIADVKTVWSHELSGFTAGDVKWALAHLPEQCPNVIKFKNLCREAPRKDEPLLPPPPKAEAQVIAANIARQTDLKNVLSGGVDPKEWAHILKRRHDAGESLSPYQVECYRTAIGLNGKQSWQ